MARSYDLTEIEIGVDQAFSVDSHRNLPAQAGIQPHGRLLWIPGLRYATPGMTILNPLLQKVL